MKIKLIPTPGTLVDIELADGKKLTDQEIKSITLDPYFTKRVEVVELLHITVKPRSREETDDCVLTVSGTTGRVARRESTLTKKRVAPAIDDPPESKSSKPASS